MPFSEPVVRHHILFDHILLHKYHLSIIQRIPSICSCIMKGMIGQLATVVSDLRKQRLHKF